MMPPFLKQLQDAGSTDRASRGLKRMEGRTAQKALGYSSRGSANASPSSKARQKAHHEFLKATERVWEKVYTDHESLPDLETALAQFKEIYPRYSETLAMESLRAQEYAHLEESGRVCLDYCGFGLFSYLQQVEEWESASFALSSMSVNFCSHALYGAAKAGTVECDIRKRIMDYLNIQETDYSMVFTASRGASFKLLADAYPFATCRRLITMYDYESESVGWLVQRAKEKGAKISNVSFKWPSLRIMSTQLRKLLVARGSRRKRGSAKGLFVFPAQSRVSGAKYSYQWMSLAQQNKWHVLLDASALGPKDMDSLGLSMFKPDFIIASFYKVFGADPSGFGCLFIKDTAMQSVQNQSGAATPGIVRIIPFPFQWSSNGSSDEHLEEGEGLVDEEGDGDAATDFEFPKSNQLIPVVASFSGPMLGFDKLSSPEDRSVRTEGVKEDDDNDSSICGSVGEVSRSPVFSEEGTENLFCLDIGASPVGSASRTSMSDDQFSGPFSGPFCGPIHNPVCDGRMNPPGPGGLQNPLFEDKSSLKNESNVKEDLKDQTPGTLKNGKDGNGMDIVTSPSMSLMEAESASIQNSQEGSLKPRQGFSQAKMTRGSPALKSKNGGFFSYPHGYDGDMDGVENREQCADVRSAGYQKFEEQNQGSEIEIVDTPTAAVISAAEPVKKMAWNQSESAIRRETEGDFRLLGRRDGNRLMPGRCLSPFTQNSEDMGSFGRGRGSFVTAEHTTDLYLSQSEDNSSCHEDNEEMGSEEAAAEQDQSDDDREPEVVCRSLDHADMLGLNKATLRLRYLINWLVSSLLQLQHLSAENSMSLVHVYGPQIKYDRGASVAFNLYDCHGKLVHPELVQMLADKSNISISIGFLQNLLVPDDDPDLHAFVDNKKTFKPSKGLHRGRVPSRIEVVTAALSVLSSFEDVYKLWLFVARFLDVDFVSKELVGHHKVLET